MPQLWKSANKSVAFGSFFLMRIPTAAWKSLAKALGFPTFTTGPTAAMQFNDHELHIKNYKGWPSDQENIAKHPPIAAKRKRVSAQPQERTGWFSDENKRKTHPVSVSFGGFAKFSWMTQTPLLAVMQGGESR